MGLYEYLVMPIGLTNTSASFQTLMNHVLQDHIDKICVIYLDNILIFSKSKEEHYKHLELIIEYLQQVELYTNPKKCDFFKLEIDFLGFIINKNSLYMDSTRVQTIIE